MSENIPGGLLPVSGTAPAVMPAAGDPKQDKARARDAAEQFEALLLAQILRSVRESSRGETDPAAGCATDFAEQQFAAVLARQGGLGLAGLIAAGLERRTEAPVENRNPQT